MEMMAKSWKSRDLPTSQSRVNLDERMGLYECRELLHFNSFSVDKSSNLYFRPAPESATHTFSLMWWNTTWQATTRPQHCFGYFDCFRALCHLPSDAGIVPQSYLSWCRHVQGGPWGRWSCITDISQEVRMLSTVKLHGCVLSMFSLSL